MKNLKRRGKKEEEERRKGDNCIKQGISPYKCIFLRFITQPRMRPGGTRLRTKFDISSTENETELFGNLVCKFKKFNRQTI